MLIINDKTLKYYFNNITELKYIKNKINYDTWEDISYFHKLPDNFIFEFKEKLIWDVISEFQILNEKLIEKCIDKINWNLISRFQILSEIFIRKYHNKLNWCFLSEFQILNEKLIEDFQNKVDWNLICNNQILSDFFLNKFSKKINWNYINMNDKIKLSSEFILNNKELNINMFIYKIDKKYFTYDFILKNKEIFNYYSWNYILENKKINEHILKIISKYFFNGTNDVFGTFINSCWSKVTKTQNLSIRFIEEFKDKLDWYVGSKYLNLNEKLICQFQNKVNWYLIFKYQQINFSKQFILKFLNKFDNYTIHYIKPAPNYIYDYGNSEEDINSLNLLKKKLKNNVINKYYISLSGDFGFNISKFI
jgi:hypothetical protein